MEKTNRFLQTLQTRMNLSLTFTIERHIIQVPQVVHWQVRSLTRLPIQLQAEVLWHHIIEYSWNTRNGDLLVGVEELVQHLLQRALEVYLPLHPWAIMKSGSNTILCHCPSYQYICY